MEPAEDRGSVAVRLRAFIPLLFCLALLIVLLGWLFHASQSRRATIRFSVAIDGTPVPYHSARLNGDPYQAGERCGLGSKFLEIDAPDAEPFQTNLHTWYSGADLGTINLARSKGTLAVEVVPARNKVVIRGQHFQKEIANCGIENLTVPVGDYEISSQFEHFQIAKRITVRRNTTESLRIQPAVAAVALSAEPADADFRFECQSGFPINLSGKTPVVLNELPLGKYLINMRRGRFCHACIVAPVPLQPKRWMCKQVLPNELQTIGDHIKARRIQLHLLQTDVAKLIGVHCASVQNRERKRTSR